MQTVCNIDFRKCAWERIKTLFCHQTSSSWLRTVILGRPITPLLNVKMNS